MPKPRSLLLPLLCVASLAVLVSTAHAAGCGRTRLIPRHSNLARVAKITFCLLNRERAAHGLRPLRANRALGRAASGHSTDMVAHAYFSHAGLYGRIIRSGYRAGRRMCAFGENIGAATGPFASPAKIVSMWMHSPQHRANILSRTFRDAGVGAAFGFPGAGGWPGATYTVEFGSRC
jgi:uncharacterized protein YkwD